MDSDDGGDEIDEANGVVEVEIDLLTYINRWLAHMEYV